jgi:hypothetical protein
MSRLSVAAVGLIGLAVAGCQTLNSPEATANAEAQRGQCNAVAVTSTSDQMRMQNQKGRDGDEMRQTEGVLALGRLKLQNPRILENPVAPEDNITSKALRAC